MDDSKLRAVRDGWIDLNDVQWMNIVNHDHAFSSFNKEDAVHTAVMMTEAKLKELNTAPIPAADHQETGGASHEDDLLDVLADIDRAKWRACAMAIHYPDCWDVSAYPTVDTAMSAVYHHFKCSACAPVTLSAGWTHDGDCALNLQTGERRPYDSQSAPRPAAEQDKIDALVAAAESVIACVVGDLPMRGWLHDTDKSRKALSNLRAAILAKKESAQ